MSGTPLALRSACPCCAHLLPVLMTWHCTGGDIKRPGAAQPERHALRRGGGRILLHRRSVDVNSRRLHHRPGHAAVHHAKAVVLIHTDR